MPERFPINRPDQPSFPIGSSAAFRRGCPALLASILLFLLLLNAAPVLSSPEKEANFGFAESLFAEGEFYRAITEYKRILFLHPQDELAERSAFRIAESYFKAKKWAEAVDAFNSFDSRYPRSRMAAEALYLKGLAERELKRHLNALQTFREVIKTKSPDYAEKAKYQSGVLFIDMEEWGKAREEFLRVSADHPLSIAARTMAAGMEDIRHIPRKQPAAAGALAGILPGAGHVYVERYRDALLALLLNGAFTWAAVELFNNKNYGAAAVVTFFELGWYTGNIYSAVSGAHKYNERQKKTFLDNLMKSSNISLSYNPALSSSNLFATFNYTLQ